MEQKRILWITAAVGVFLLVVIGAALILYSPSQQYSQSKASQPVITSIQGQGNTWVSQGTQDAIVNTSDLATSANLAAQQSPAVAQIPAQIPVTAQNTTSVANNPTSDVGVVKEVSTDINGKDVTVISGTTHVYTTGTTTTIDLNSLKSGGTAQITTVPANTSVAPVAQANVVEQTASKAVVEKPSTTVAKVEPEKKATTTTTTAASKATTSTASKTVSTKQYWVQAASFTSKKNAEEARAALTAAEITGEIFTYQDAKGALYYRVRVGPYTTTSEAEYWKARIVKLDMFSASQCYVTNTTIASVK